MPNDRSAHILKVLYNIIKECSLIEEGYIHGGNRLRASKIFRMSVCKHNSNHHFFQITCLPSERSRTEHLKLHCVKNLGKGRQTFTEALRPAVIGEAS